MIIETQNSSVFQFEDVPSYYLVKLSGSSASHYLLPKLECFALTLKTYFDSCRHNIVMSWCFTYMVDDLPPTYL